jgi:hypothetical protein
MSAITEAEARTKWCPFARVASGNGDFAENRVPAWRSKASDPRADGSFCIASDCMAWRRAYDPFVDQAWGYCGIAGRPS